MRRKDDQRLWLDKADGKTLYGLFPDQRFYSIQYFATDAEREFAQKVGVYNEWCKAAFLAARSGQQVPEFPAELISVETEADYGEAEATPTQPDPERS